MRIVLHRLFNSKVIHNLRSLYTSRVTKGSAYDGPEKTTVTILNQNEYVLMINSFDPTGFLLNNGIKMIGPMLLFPRSLLYWNVATARDINKDSLMLFDILEPKIDLLILGLEDHYEHQFILKLKAILKELDIKNEIHPVRQACSIFNFVCNEGRYVAAALIPPTVKAMQQSSSLQCYIQNVDKAINNKVSPDEKEEENLINKK